MLGECYYPCAHNLIKKADLTGRKWGLERGQWSSTLSQETSGLFKFRFRKLLGFEEKMSAWDSNAFHSWPRCHRRLGRMWWFSIISRGDDAHAVIPGRILQARSWGRKVKCYLNIQVSREGLLLGTLNSYSSDTANNDTAWQGLSFLRLSTKGFASSISLNSLKNLWGRCFYYTYFTGKKS